MIGRRYCTATTTTRRRSITKASTWAIVWPWPCDFALTRPIASPSETRRAKMRRAKTRRAEMRRAKTRRAEKGKRRNDPALKGEFSSTRKHTRGVLSMARANDPDSALTSFFIVLAPPPNLDGKYSIFVKVVDGFDTLEKMEKVGRAPGGETPVERIELIEAVIKP